MSQCHSVTEWIDLLPRGVFLCGFILIVIDIDGETERQRDVQVENRCDSTHCQMASVSKLLWVNGNDVDCWRKLRMNWSSIEGGKKNVARYERWNYVAPLSGVKYNNLRNATFFPVKIFHTCMYEKRQFWKLETKELVQFRNWKSYALIINRPRCVYYGYISSGQYHANNVTTRTALGMHARLIVSCSPISLSPQRLRGRNRTFFLISCVVPTTIRHWRQFYKDLWIWIFHVISITSRAVSRS